MEYISTTKGDIYFNEHPHSDSENVATVTFKLTESILTRMGVIGKHN